MAKDSLIDFVRENSSIGSLREVIGNYFVNPYTNQDLPLDDKECKKLITEAMNLYFRLNDLKWQ